jgi:dipeptidyl aminopeptidase/acylaminoacyl peptidase
LIHGGPQGAWGNSWTYRWNAELFAADGYVVVMINFHGSTGYGQKFTDSISGDWGGKPYVDLMKGLDYVEKTYPFIDKNREAALGASYGGYMANWILGHTNRFRCIVSHVRHVQRRVGLRDERRTLVSRVGVQRYAVEKSRAISEILAAFVRRQIQNADAGCPRPE